MVAGAVVDTFGGAAAQFQEAKLKRVSAAGFALLVLAYLFMAPAFARDALERLSVFTVALVALGVGVGLTIIPTLSDMQSIVERHQANNGRHTDDVSAKVSGIWGSAYGLGSAIGIQFEQLRGTFNDAGGVVCRAYRGRRSRRLSRYQLGVVYIWDCMRCRTCIEYLWSVCVILA